MHVYEMLLLRGVWAPRPVRFGGKDFFLVWCVLSPPCVGHSVLLG